MIRKLLAPLLAAGLAVAAIAPAGPARAAGRVRVVATTSDEAYLVRTVGGDRVDVALMAKGYQDPHFIEPRPSDIVKIQRAQLFVAMGLELEIWANPLLDAAHNSHLVRVDTSEGIDVLEKPSFNVTPQYGDLHPYGNPHYETDPANWPTMAADVAEGLERVDPDGAATYRANLRAFDAQANAALSRWARELAPYRGQRFIDYHREWVYFSHRYGLPIAGYIEAKPGVPPSPAHLQDVIRTVRQDRVRMLVREPWQDARYPELVARETGARIALLPPSIDGVPGTDTYFKLFDHVVGEVVRAMR